MILKIALRSTLRQKRRTILTALTMFGGFVLASVSVGWSDGTYSRIINMFTRNRLGHIQVHGQGYLDKPSIYNTIEDYKKAGQKIGDLDGVEAWAPRVFSAGLASVSDNSTAAQVIGVNPLLEQKATRFDRKITKGESFADTASHSAILGTGLATVLKAEVGDSVIIVSQAADGSIANDIYEIVGLLQSGDTMSDRMSLYLHISDAQELFFLPDQAHEIAVIVHDLDKVDVMTDKIRKTLDNPELSVKPWQEFARSFYQAMRADQQGMWIMIFVIVLIVAIGVLNTVLMSVLERTKEYGVQKAIGTQPGQIFLQVIYEVNAIALVSVIIGAGLSIIANSMLSVHGIDLPQAFTYGGIEFKTMYSEVSLQSLYIPALTVILAASIVSIFPALRAAHIEPAKAMRTH